MSISFPGESPEYRTARNRLLLQEVELRRATDAVAVARRALPCKRQGDSGSSLN